MKKWFVAALLCAGLTAHAQEYRSYPMWNPDLPLEQRVNDVLSRLTLEEKVAQMLNATPAIPRLGIPAYDWWNEVLHGVARTPFKVTSYPQAIGMAATWDSSSLKTMADYSATEGRAIYNEALRLGRTNERYLGLTYWTPNINIFRDPRWGRGQETYGEDPFLTAMLGAAFVRGLQGDDPNYLKAAACAKHFAVHSGPEPSRHSDNFNPSIYDLWDTYLPAFRELITKANVAGVMCAYNAVDTQPCCANDQLMNDILRKQWNFTGYVTSDCWAIDDFFKYHKTHTNPTVSAVDAVMHGTDIECGQTVYKTLLDAVKTGLISEAQLDVSLRRLFTIRYRLGMFDPPSRVKFAQTSMEVLESEPHRQHALKMARQSIVLLKNVSNTLPLKKNLRRIAVLGPNADNPIAVLGNYNGTPSRVVTLLDGLREKLGPSVEIIYEKAINFTNDTLLIYKDYSSFYKMDGISGVKAEYFNNENLEGRPAFTRMEKDIDHLWAEGELPAAGMQPSHFSARYSTVFTAPRDEWLTFEVSADDGYRMYVDDSLYIDAWLRNRWGPRQLKLAVQKGQQYRLRLEYHQSVGSASVRLKPGEYVKTNFADLAQRLGHVDAILFAGGISPQLEGEEMPVNAPGFNGGDRTSIQLPTVQTNLLKALHQTGKPVIFVMMTGSAIAIPWEAEQLPAIVNSWYGGQSAGTAIADVLFGDYNPAGRLPVTFYKSDTDLPDFMSYDMRNRTYRYFKGQALYPFGFGLSYTRFHYSEIKVPPVSKANEPLPVSVWVQNTGERDGDEVVQLYISYPDFKGRAPQRALKGFQRIHLKAGERRQIQFTLMPDDLALVDEVSGRSFVPQEKLRISLGGGQPDQAIVGSSNTISATTKIN